MKPYYQDEAVTIYNGDCRDVLPTLDKVDLVLTDPPYGMNYKPLRGSDGSKRFSDGIIGDNSPFNPAPILALSLPTIMWGANWYASRLPDSGGWLIWDKTPLGAKQGFIASTAEIAWSNIKGRIFTYRMQWGGEAHGGEDHFHPTQKPVALMRWCIEVAEYPSVILDPFMGSGTTLRAAKDLGRKAIGIEIEERYCEIAAKRMSQLVLAI